MPFNHSDILGKHCLIEASAGAGKTYTIERLMVNMLLNSEEDVSLENILLVTFTEKAAGEMRARVRTNLQETIRTLEEEGKANSSAYKKLKRELHSFQRAEITTIHSWCKSVLTQFPFEGAKPFQQHLVDKNTLIEKTFFEFLRKEQEHIDWSAFSEGVRTKQINVSHAQSAFLNILKDYNVLHDDIQPNQQSEWESFTNNIKAKIPDLWKESVPWDEVSKWFQNNSTLLKKGKLESIQKVLDMAEFFERMLWDIYNNEWSLSRLKEYYQEFTYGFRLKKLVLKTHITKKGEEECGSFLNSVCPNFDRIMNAIQQVRDLFETCKDTFAGADIKGLVEQLASYIDVKKKEQSLQTFDDLLLGCQELIQGSKFVRESLQSKYRYILIDEYQDTNYTQWSIFRALIDSSSSPLNLYLIGDPKQSIYSFNGADIDIYFQSREYLFRQYQKNHALGLSITNNYRSSKDIIEGFNVLFSSEAWFRRPEEETIRDENWRLSMEHVNYAPVGFGDIPAQHSSASQHGLKAYHVRNYLLPDVDLESGVIRNDYLKWIAHQMVHLSRKKISFGVKGNTLGFNQMAVLVRSANEGKKVVKYLLSCGINATFYKRKGIYQSSETLEVLYLLQALIKYPDLEYLSPLLHTYFFLGNTEEGISFEEGISSELERLILKWKEYTQQKKWGALFQSALQDSCLSMRMMELNEGEQKTQIYKQIFDELSEVAYRENYSLHYLFNHLRKLYFDQNDNEDNGELFKNISISKAVQVMTIHASKGLEFGAVFMYCGFESLRNAGPGKIKNEKGNGYTFHLVEKKDREKIQDEIKRLYYVAITRAKFFLYMPHCEIGQYKSFISQATKDLLVRDDLCQTHYETPFEDVQYIPDAISQQNNVSSKSSEEGIPIVSNSKNWASMIIRKSSYSQLAHASHFTHPEENQDEFFKGDTQELKEKKSLVGAGFGNLVHLILEEIHFETVNPDWQLNEFMENLKTDTISNLLDQFHIDEGDKPFVWQLIYNTLRQKYDLGHETLYLYALSKEQQLKEMEFQFSFAKEGQVFRGDSFTGTVIGFVDMVFLWNGKYYILDWKSNKVDAYDQQSIYTNMMENAYHLQWKVYCRALHQWLSQNMPDYDYETHFGGVLYVYVRGTSTEGSNGYYFAKPTLHELTVEYTNELTSLLSRRYS